MARYTLPMETTIRALFVDDDTSLLNGLRRALYRKAKEWDLQFVDSGQAALERMDQQPFEVIISDMRMPNMNGVELLKIVRERFPETVRFVLSGYSDRQMILESIGLSHQFFAKPCDPEHLIHAIFLSTSLYRHLGNPATQRIISRITDLPTPPPVYHEMTRELSKPEPSLEQLTGLIMKDAALSARVLQMVNSAFFGIGREVSSIEQATLFLGVENLRSLVLILGISNEAFTNLKSTFDLDLYTQHSIEVGATAQNIAKDLGWERAQAQVAFTAGLLHDVGKLLMATHFQERYCDCDTFSLRTPGAAHAQECEDACFGTNHALMGASLLALWGIPPNVINAIAFHHKPQDDIVTGISLSTVVHIANAIVYLRSIPQGKQSLSSDVLLNQTHIHSLGISEQISKWMKPRPSN